MKPFNESITNIAKKITNRARNNHHITPGPSSPTSSIQSQQNLLTNEEVDMETDDTEVDEGVDLLPNNQMDQLRRTLQKAKANNKQPQNTTRKDNTQQQQRFLITTNRRTTQREPNNNKRTRTVRPDLETANQIAKKHKGNELNIASSITTIMEKTINTNNIIVGNNEHDEIMKMLKEEYIKELSTRLSTIVLTLDNQNDNYTKVINTIDKLWTNDKNKPVPQYFRDKEHMYVSFENREEKISFLKWTREEKQTDTTTLDNLIKLTGDQLNNFKRRLTRIELPNLNVKLVDPEQLGNQLKNLIINNNGVFENFKIGQPYNMKKHRSIYFSTDEVGTGKLVTSLRGKTNYISQTGTNSIIMQLKIKILCQPWLCNGCLEYKNHKISECKVRRCNKCGWENHTANECKGLAFCRSCRRSGHRTRDKSCPTYIQHSIRELRKMQIPLDIYRENADILLKMMKNK